MCPSPRYAARDKSRLIQLGITHVVNVAAGKFQVDTGAKFYRGTPLEYYGIEADDNPFFDLSVYFLPVARYIREALNTPRSEQLGTGSGRLGSGRDEASSISPVALWVGSLLHQPHRRPSHSKEQVPITT